MKRTTIMLPPELRAEAAIFAKQKGLSLGELIRQCLQEQVAKCDASPQGDPFWNDFTPYQGSGPTDIAARHDDYLYGEDE